MDPFVAFEYEGKKFRTKVAHDGGRNPHWGEVNIIISLTDLTFVLRSFVLELETCIMNLNLWLWMTSYSGPKQ